MPRKSLINLIYVEEKIIDSSGSYLEEALDSIKVEEVKLPNENQSHNAKAAAAYFN